MSRWRAAPRTPTPSTSCASTTTTTATRSWAWAAWPTATPTPSVPPSRRTGIPTSPSRTATVRSTSTRTGRSAASRASMRRCWSRPTATSSCPAPPTSTAACMSRPTARTSSPSRTCAPTITATSTTTTWSSSCLCCECNSSPLRTPRWGGIPLLQRYLREPLHLVLEFGHAVGRDHERAGVVDADLPEAVDLLEDEVRRAHEVSHDLLGEVAAGIGERLAMGDQARFHIAALGLLGGLRDGHRELRRDLDLGGIAAELGGT